MAISTNHIPDIWVSQFQNGRPDVCLCYSKITQKKIVQRERLEANKNRAPVLTKDARVDEACERSEYQPPCSLGQVSINHRAHWVRSVPTTVLTGSGQYQPPCSLGQVSITGSGHVDESCQRSEYQPPYALWVVLVLLGRVSIIHHAIWVSLA